MNTKQWIIGAGAATVLACAAPAYSQLLGGNIVGGLGGAAGGSTGGPASGAIMGALGGSYDSDTNAFGHSPLGARRAGDLAAATAEDTSAQANATRPARPKPILDKAAAAQAGTQSSTSSVASATKPASTPASAADQTTKPQPRSARASADASAGSEMNVDAHR
jgi:hypothetical protein